MYFFLDSEMEIGFQRSIPTMRLTWWYLEFVIGKIKTQLRT